MKKLTFILITLISSAALIAQDQTVNGIFYQNMNNQWLSPAKFQIGRIDRTIYKDRAVVGVTDGNLHLDAYSGRYLLLNFYQEGSTSGSKGMTIDPEGNVGIGLNKPTFKLEVNGTIRSKEVKIEATGWSDFVFNKDYNLPTLQAVEQHINDKGYLPGIPSEKQVIEEGVNVVEMQAKLLQKIEELTLYIIEQDKRIQELESRLEKKE